MEDSLSSLLVSRLSLSLLALCTLPDIVLYPCQLAGTCILFSFLPSFVSLDSALFWVFRGSSQKETIQGMSLPSGCYVSLWSVPLSLGFSRQEYWSGLPFPSPGDLPNPGMEPRSPTLQEDSLPTEPPGKSPSLTSWNQTFALFLECEALLLDMNPGVPPCPRIKNFYAIQPSHPLSPPPPAFNLSQHQGLFQWVSYLHQVATVLELQL